MASIESRLFYSLLRLINKKKFLEMQFAFGKFDFNNSKEPPVELTRKINVKKHTVNNRAVFTLSPKSKATGTHILYLHGGAYVQNFVKQHWYFLSMLVEQTHCTIVAPDYPLAPKHTFVAAFDLVISLYKTLITEVGSNHTILMGDSAGGGFALALAQRMRQEDALQPNKIILLSPWLDITLTNPDIKKIDLIDPFLGIHGLRKAGLAYAGDADPGNFLLSPINGPLDQLGEISLFIGSRDIFVADARKLYIVAKEKGIKINYREYEDMVHVWMLLNFRESKLAKQEIMSLIIEHR
ncbi:MAG TPA: alpha/beta hydrolase [Ohtaekwangia sp.]|nr:alpha/beta hydrolase [Ohtaekwangia sp.]